MSEPRTAALLYGGSRAAIVVRGKRVYYLSLDSPAPEETNHISVGYLLIFGREPFRQFTGISRYPFQPIRKMLERLGAPATREAKKKRSRNQRRGEG